MKISLPPLRQWLLGSGLLFLGWYSAHIIPVDPELNYMELKAARTHHEEAIELLKTCAAVEGENTDLIHLINDEITDRVRTTVDIDSPTLDIPHSADANEVKAGIRDLGLGLIVQRQALKFILQYILDKKGLTNTP